MGKIDPEDIVNTKNDITKAYNSIEARKRLSKFINPSLVSRVIGDGTNRVKTAGVIEKDLTNSEYGAKYNVPTNTVTINNQDMLSPQDNLLTQESTLTHELSHGFFGNKNKVGMQKFIDTHISQSKADELNIGGDQDKLMYLTDSEEVRARLNQLRQSRDKNNWWKTWTPEDLKNNNHPMLEELRQVFDDDKITNMLNTLASNSANQFGGLT